MDPQESSVSGKRGFGPPGIGLWKGSTSWTAEQVIAILSRGGRRTIRRAATLG